jgi:hypothetical protein
MPLYSLIENAFEPDHCRAMAVAFERVLRELGLLDRNDPLCNIIARKIIEFGQQGVVESARLRDLTMKALQD